MKSSKWIGRLHDRRVLSRRATTLAGLLAKVIPGNATVLDVGSGDGLVGYLIGQDRIDLRISGVDLLIRRDTPIPITQFDGKKLPFEDKTFDVCLFIDVLHHTNNQLDLLKEALRVSRRGLVIKDHLFCRIRLCASWTGSETHTKALRSPIITGRQANGMRRSRRSI